MLIRLRFTHFALLGVGIFSAVAALLQLLRLLGESKLVSYEFASSEPCFRIPVRDNVRAGEGLPPLRLGDQKPHEAWPDPCVGDSKTLDFVKVFRVSKSAEADGSVFLLGVGGG